MSQLIRAKSRWDVSLANLAYRMHKLSLLSDWQYRSIFIELNRRGRENEPYAPGRGPLRQGTSQILEKVFRALRDEKMTKSLVAQQLHIPLTDLSASVFGLVLTPLEGLGATDGATAFGDPPKLYVV